MIEFLLFVGVIILLFWTSSLSNRIKVLEKSQGMAPQKTPAPGREALKPFAEPEPSRQPSSSRQLFGEHQPERAVAAPPPPMDYHRGQTATKPAQLPEKHDMEIETRLATNWASKIGVVAILLGMAFFFKYAVDQGWIVPWMRIVIGFLVGGLFVFLGWLWKEKYDKYANVIMGGGIAILYFTIFAAYDFYHLFPQWLALGLMVIASILSVYLAEKRKSLPLAVLGLLGAYGAPVVLSSGQNRQIQLFVYLTVLNVAVLTVTVKNFWTSLLYFALLATVADYSLWVGQYSNNFNVNPSALFLLVTFVLFTVVPATLLRKHFNAKTLPAKVDNRLGIFAILLGLVFLAFSADLLFDLFRNLYVLALLAGALSGFIAYAIIDRLEFKSLNYCLTFAASALTVFSFCAYFHDKPLALALILLANFGVVCAVMFKRVELRVWALSILLFSLFAALAQSYPAESLFLLNAKFGLLLLASASMFFASLLYKYFPESGMEKGLRGLLIGAGALMLWAVVSLDISHYLTGLNGQYSLALWWIVFPAILSGLSVYFKRPGLVILSLFLAALGLIKSLLIPYDPVAARFIMNYKFGLMLLEVISLFYIGWLAEKKGAELFTKGTDKVLLAVTVVFFWIAFSWDITHAYFGLFGNYACTLWWVIYPMLLAFLGALLRKPILGKIALVLLVLGFFRTLWLPYREYSYVFLFNAKFGLMLLQALGLIFIAKFAVSAEMLENEKSSAALADLFKVVASMLLWFAFSWELVHYYSDAISANTRNLTLSLWWIAYATILITYGAINKAPVFRKVAIALFLLSILKVFLYDVQALDTVYRIVSFIVLGIILLSVSFAYQRNKEKITEFLAGEKQVNNP